MGRVSAEGVNSVPYLASLALWVSVGLWFWTARGSLLRSAAEGCEERKLEVFSGCLRD